MHKTFYASGFLFHLPSQQILLRQYQSKSTITSPWVLFEKEHAENKTPNEVFEKEVLKHLDVDIDSVVQIYAYNSNDNTKSYTLFYASVKKLEDYPPKNGHAFRWFSFKEVLKIKAAEQTKHDIVVGQRVIESVKRKKAGERSL
jgi:hypothetical protein